MKVLVTGADGFVGKHLVKALRARGDRVEECDGPEGAAGLEVTSPAAVRARFEQFRPEGVVHLAGVSSVAWSHQNAAETVRVNVLGTANVLEAVRMLSPAARVLLVGSGEEYGKLVPGIPARESSPLAPLSPYAASKAAAEMLGRQAAASWGVHVVLVRPFNHLGAGQAPQFVIPSFARQLLAISQKKAAPVIRVGDLTPVRDFTHVADVVDAYLLLLDRGLSGEVYNVCSGEGLSIEQALKLLQELAGTTARIEVDPERLRPAEIPWLVGDPGKLEQLGWRRTRRVRQALTEVLEESGA